VQAQESPATLFVSTQPPLNVLFRLNLQFIVSNNPHSVLVRAQDGDFASNDSQEEETEVIFLEYAENVSLLDH
jgi:hypothetical protein